jgi:CRISPR-associated protein Cas5d
MKSRMFKISIKGKRACFTRPETPLERLSYEVITPSAARGVFEALLWHPGIRWHISRIHVLNPIRFEAIRRNEVISVCGMGKQNAKQLYNCYNEDVRTQRSTIFLKDVHYVVEGSFILESNASEDNVAKFEAMFFRRLEKGQHHHQPYLGMREFPAEVGHAPDRWDVLPEFAFKPLGPMHYDFDYRGEQKNRPMGFDATIRNGVIEVPDIDSIHP